MPKTYEHITLSISRHGIHERTLVFEARCPNGQAEFFVRETNRHFGLAESERLYKMPRVWFLDIVDELQSLKIPVLPEIVTNESDQVTELRLQGPDGELLAAYRWLTIPHGGWEKLEHLARRMTFLYAYFKKVGGDGKGAMCPQYLTTCPVVGMHFVPAIDDLMAYLTEGSRVRLVRERDNKFDSRAIAVHLNPTLACGKKDRVGYVARTHNASMAELIDAGAELEGVVIDVHGETGFPVLKIDVFKKNGDDK